MHLPSFSTPLAANVAKVAAASFGIAAAYCVAVGSSPMRLTDADTIELPCHLG